MADGVNIDWSLARPQQNFTDTYANAFAAGRAIAGQQIQGNAMQAYLAKPMTPVDPRLMATNPRLALPLHDRQGTDQAPQVTVQGATALSHGDAQRSMATAAESVEVDKLQDLHDQILAMTAQAQAAVLQKLTLVDKIAQSIKGRTTDPNERAAIAQHVAQTQPGLGIDPATLTPDKLTDANIDAMHGLVTDATQKIAEAKLQAEIDLDREASRQSQAHEGIRGQEVGIQCGQLGTAERRLAPEHQKASAQGELTPAVMAPMSPDQWRAEDAALLAKYGVL